MFYGSCNKTFSGWNLLTVKPSGVIKLPPPLPPLEAGIFNYLVCVVGPGLS